MSATGSVLAELVPASRSLYLVFGGIAAGIGMPPFEFYRSSAILGESRVFFRDLSQAWYHNGLDGVSTDVPGTAAYLAALVAQCRPERLYFVGNSMGGFAAFLFAHLGGRGHVIMFSPQTFISRLKRLLHADRRWRRQVSAAYRATRSKTRCFDLSQLERYSPQVSARRVSITTLGQRAMLRACARSRRASSDTSTRADTCGL